MSYIITFVAGVLVGGIGSYLALRNNPKVRSTLDSVGKSTPPQS